MIKTNEKPNPQVTTTLEQEVVNFRRGLKEAEMILTLKSNPAWELLQGNIKERLERLEMQLDKFEQLGERELVLALKERKDFRWVVDVTDRIEEGLPKIHAALADTERRLAERKAAGGPK